MDNPPRASSVKHLLDIGRALTRELDQQVVLERLLETAGEITGARYAALGVLNERGDGLERFVTAGIDEETRRAIGEEPRGHGRAGRGNIAGPAAHQHAESSHGHGAVISEGSAGL